MPRPQIDYTRAAAAAAASESQQHCLRPSSFDLTHRHEDEDDELNLLNQHMHVLMSSSASSSSSARRRRRYDGEDEEEEDDDGTEQRAPREEEECQTSTDMEYGCEVLTFGRAHHCALGGCGHGWCNHHHKEHERDLVVSFVKWVFHNNNDNQHQHHHDNLSPPTCPSLCAIRSGTSIECRGCGRCRPSYLGVEQGRTSLCFRIGQGGKIGNWQP